ncbi:hypothetical protein FB556_0771 [Enteractinococcus coprophilus]|uniref:Uncharacterized protein n=2 Tax=Enteractinococcus coprophilus TaxID=1027633 RepID=A0A543AP02_9MICC|nr:hypothetical protein FB556_0771 [Enteractinococcus coprophilus]
MARRRNKTPTRTQTVVTLLIMFGGLLLMTWAFTDPWRDAQNFTWVECEVMSAKTQRGGRNSSVPWYVAVETRDCGTVVYRVGTSQDNVEGVAAQFEPGPYEFKFGAVSQRRAQGGTLLGHAADAKDFRRLPTEENRAVSDVQ